MLIHKGIRPVYSIQVLDFKRKLYVEERPDGTYKIWNKKMLRSGCGGKVNPRPDRLMNCIYCPYCHEWFSEEQWEKIDEEKRTP